MVESEPLKIAPGNLEKIFRSQKERAKEQRMLSVTRRKTLLRDFEKFLLQHRERIVSEIHKDFAKPPVEAALSELYPVLTEIRHAIANLDRWARPKKIDAPLTFLGTRSEVRYEPKGVCLIISPWNFPFNLCFGPLISCLAAGNTAILKPSELTPAASVLIRNLVSEFFDDDLVSVVEGGVDESTALLKLPFDHIFFTGSPAVGKIVMKAAAESLTSITLELGGKSPVIVDETANIKDAARRIGFGKFMNNGQTCIAPDYVMVHHSVRKKLIEELKKNVVGLFGDEGKLGETATSYSRIVDQKNFNRVTGMIEDSIAHGAIIEWSGPVNATTRFIHPVIVSGVPPDARLMTEEIFGPVLPILSFGNVEEVTTMINSKQKPLALYIFSGSKKFRERILSTTSAGGVCINDCLIQFSHPELPFGGVNHSGIGKAHGHYGFLAFSNEKPIVRQRRGFTAFYFIQPPYTSGVRKITDFILRWL